MAIINGTAADDVLSGAVGNDVLYGFGGNDIFLTEYGIDRYDGGSGVDTLDFSGSLADGLDFDMSAGRLTFPGGIVETFVRIENIIGSNGGDTMLGDGFANVLNGGAGNDRIDGGAGADTLIGGAGNDLLIGGGALDSFDGGSGVDTVDYSYSTQNGTMISLASGRTTFASGGVETLVRIENVTGSQGNDIIVGNATANVLEGGRGNDTIDGGGGNDIAVYSLARSNYTVDVAGNGTVTVSGGPDGTDTLTNIETLRFADGDVPATGSSGNPPLEGTAGADTLIGTSGDDTINGYGGNDRIDGGAGEDAIFGGAGNDVLIGGFGADDFDGGSGIDTVDYSYSTQAGTVMNLATGFTTFDSGGTEALVRIENIVGSQAGDVIIGNSGANVLSGGAGNDTIRGGGGNDQIDGGSGIDLAVFSQVRSAYDVGFLSGGRVTISGGGDGTDTLTGIEVVRFADGDVDISDLVDPPDTPPPSSFLDIRDYGAVANDGRDDSAAIQAALDAAAKAGVDVYMPAGNFHYSRELNIRSTSLMGDGFDTVLIPTNANRTNIMLTGTAPEVHDFTMAMPFEQTRAHSWGWNRVGVQEARDFVIEGVMIEGARAAGIHIESNGIGVQGGVIRGNVIANTKSSGIHITQKVSDIVIEDNWIQSTGDTGIELIGYERHADQPHDILIQDNVVIDNDWGKNIDVAGVRDVQIVNNFVSDNTAGVTGIMVDVNTHYDLSPTDNVLIKGNIVQGAGSFTFGHGGITIAASNSPSTNIVVEDNIVLDAGKQGVTIVGGQYKDVTVQDNTLAGLRFIDIETLGPGDFDIDSNTTVDQRASEAVTDWWRLDEPYNADIRSLMWGTDLNQMDPSISPASDGRIVVDTDDMLPHILRGTTASETISGSSRNELLIGDDGSDVLRGNGGDDLLVGGTGADRLYGGSGNDGIIGNRGADELHGEAGNDRLAGGAGVDVYYGGSGRDQFSVSDWSGTADRNIVRDFVSGEDTLDLTMYMTGYHGGARTNFLKMEKIGADDYRIDLDPTGNGNHGVAFEIYNTNLRDETLTGMILNGDVLI